MTTLENKRAIKFVGGYQMKDSKENCKQVNMTVDYYNKNARQYSKETFSVDFEEKQNILLKYLNLGDHILDLGCGSGRDSKAFIEKGYKVTATDGSIELCKIASKNIGQEVICEKFKDLNEESKYDAVWACASLIHLPPDQLNNLMINITKALKDGGYIYTSFKFGNFEGEIKGRYFLYFKEDSFEMFIRQFRDLELVEVQITEDVRIGREDQIWLNAIVRKK